jgi:hypothetical protein
MGEPALRIPRAPRGDLARQKGGTRPSPADRLARAGTRFALVAVAVQTAVHLINGLLFEGRWEALKADGEFGVFSWASSSATIAAAFATAVLAIETRAGVRCWGLVLVFAYFSLDDRLVIHERLGRLSPVTAVLPAAGPHLVWIATLAPLLAAAFFLIRGLARRSPNPTRRLLTIGLACLVAAVVAETIGGGLLALGWSEESAGYEVEIAVEEAAELGGWILIAFGLMARVVASGTEAFNEGNSWHR